MRVGACPTVRSPGRGFNKTTQSMVLALSGVVGYQSPQDPESRKCLGDELVPLPPHSPALTLEGLENWLVRWGWKGC